MEEFLLKLVSNLGVAGVGFAFLYIVMREYFKQMKSVIEEIGKMCEEIKQLVTSFNSLKELQAVQSEIDRALTEDIKDSYIKISNKIEQQNSKIDEIYLMCHELTDSKSRIPFGLLALSKGYLNETQIDELLEEQEKLGRN